MWWWLLLGLLLFSQCLLQTHTLPGVVLPMQKLLLINELGTLRVNQLLSEVFVLQELQHVQAVRIFQELGIFWLLPVKQIFQIVNEGSLPQDTPLSQKVEVVWVGQTLDKLQL